MSYFGHYTRTVTIVFMATPKDCFRVCGLEYSVLLVMEWMHNIYLCCSALSLCTL